MRRKLLDLNLENVQATDNQFVDFADKELFSPHSLACLISAAMMF